MLFKLIAAFLVAYAGWWVWKGPQGNPRPIRPTIPADKTAARAVLGLDADANADEIRAAHRRLIAAVHPDRGGSAELTRRVNAARDTLLRPD